MKLSLSYWQFSTRLRENPTAAMLKVINITGEYLGSCDVSYWNIDTFIYTAVITLK